MKNITSKHVELLQKHKGIIYAVLNRCHISHRDPHYDDYLQIGQITFLTTLAAYEKPYDTKVDWQIFVGYVSQKIYWRLLNELKRQRENKYDLISLNSDFLTYYHDEDGENFIATLEIKNHLYLFRQTLTPKEILLLDDLILHGLTMTEHAHKQHIARSTAYLRRNQLAKKYRHFLQQHEL